MLHKTEGEKKDRTNKCVCVCVCVCVFVRMDGARGTKPRSLRGMRICANKILFPSVARIDSEPWAQRRGKEQFSVTVDRNPRLQR